MSSEGSPANTTSRSLAKDSIIYGAGSLASPLAQFVLIPVFAGALGETGYGQLAVLLVFQSLLITVAGLGMASAFFRVYGLDHTAGAERARVVSTGWWLVAGVGLVFIVLTGLAATALSSALVGSPDLAGVVAGVSVVALLENIAAYGLARHRALAQPVTFALIVAAKFLFMTTLSVIAVQVFDLGIGGALLGAGAGSLVAVLLTVPPMIRAAGLAFDRTMARELLSFGAPLVPAALLFWVLQLSDRFLLSRLATLAEVGVYSVAYNVGMLVSVLVIGPFTLAWPQYLYAAARAGVAERAVPAVASNLALVAGIAALGVTGLARIGLSLFGGGAFLSGMDIVPWVATAGVLFGLYYVFSAGLNLAKATRFLPVVMAIGAVSNVFLNLLLIPPFGPRGAAISTLVSYAFLAGSALVASSRFRYLPFAVLPIAATVGVTLVGSLALAGVAPPYGPALYSAAVALLIVRLARGTGGHLPGRPDATGGAG